MKRHPALQDLSRDHYTALRTARILSRPRPGEDRGPAEAAQELLAFWDRELVWHFREEEELLLPLVAGHVQPTALEEVRRMLDDHATIRAGVLQLRDPAPGTPGTAGLLQHLGRLLHDHVRMEERRLFPRLQELLTEPELAILAARSESFRRRCRGPRAVGPRRS